MVHLFMKNIIVLFLGFYGIVLCASPITKDIIFSQIDQSIDLSQNQPNRASVVVIELPDEVDFKKIMFDLVKAAKNKEIHGILLVINCSGGRSDMFSSLHDLIKKIGYKKPIIGLVVGSARSAGYLCVSACNYIIASTASYIGTIGVTISIERFKNPKMIGQVEADLNVEFIKIGEFKGLDNPYSISLSDKDREYLQSLLQKNYDLFLKLIAENRGVCLEQYKEWAEGKTFLSDEALYYNLIDEIGTIFEAEIKLKELIQKQNTDKILEGIEFIYQSENKNQD